MKTKTSLILLTVFFLLLTSCSAITGKVSFSRLKIKEENVESAVICFSGYNTTVTLNEEETEKFIELFNKVSEGIVPQGELATPDTSVSFKYKDGKTVRFYFYGKDYSTHEINFDKDGAHEDFYYFQSNELRDFVYQTRDKYSENK